ncbi:MAG: VOC family protein, partial [Corynebacterium marinum]|nr:VOC family protein [Corynebacterium marinum]
MTTTHHVGDPCWMELASPDPAAAETFYGPLFGWEFADVDGL